jgi:phosphomannomutase
MDPETFGTDYITGIYPGQIDEEDAWKIGHATARFLRSLLTGYERGQSNTQSLCAGRDMRANSEPVAKALIEGMNASGANVIDIGIIDTPRMCFAINHLGTCGGVQVTGSHKNARYTGFKIFGLGAKPVSTDTGLQDIEHVSQALIHTKSAVSASVIERDLSQEYKEHVLKFLGPRKKKLKIAVDASNGVAGRLIPAFFKGLPVDIIDLNFEYENGFKHEPNPLIEKNLSQIKSAVKKNKCHFGVCFDSDAERIVVIDDKGEPVSCDLMTAAMVPYFLSSNPKSAIVYDLRSSRIVIEEIIKHGGTPRRERVGPAYMKKAMRDSHAVFGADLCGRFFYRDNFDSESGIITLVHLINIVRELKTPLSELIAPLRRYFNSGQLKFKVDEPQVKLDELARRYSDGQIDYFDGMTVGYKDWWFNCRVSKNEPVLLLNVEARSEELLESKLSEIKEQFGEPI